MQARAGHFAVLRELLPYIWPAGRPDLRKRVVLALIALILAKLVTLAVPIAYKQVVDLLTGEAPERRPSVSSPFPPFSSSPMASAAC